MGTVSAEERKRPTERSITTKRNITMEFSGRILRGKIAVRVYATSLRFLTLSYHPFPGHVVHCPTFQQCDDDNNNKNHIWSKTAAQKAIFDVGSSECFTQIHCVHHDSKEALMKSTTRTNTSTTEGVVTAVCWTATGNQSQGTRRFNFLVRPA